MRALTLVGGLVLVMSTVSVGIVPAYAGVYPVSGNANWCGINGFLGHVYKTAPDTGNGQSWRDETTVTLNILTGGWWCGYPLIKYVHLRVWDDVGEVRDVTVGATYSLHWDWGLTFHPNKWHHVRVGFLYYCWNCFAPIEAFHIGQLDLFAP